MFNTLQTKFQSQDLKVQVRARHLNKLHLLNCFFFGLSRVFRSTLCNIPQTQSLLNKAKMPLGLLLHPFKDLSVTPQFNI